MKIIWTIFAVASAGALYFTPGPHHGEIAVHYIMSERTTWQAMLCTVVASFAASILLMAYLMRPDREAP